MSILARIFKRKGKKPKTESIVEKAQETQQVQQQQTVIEQKTAEVEIEEVYELQIYDEASRGWKPVLTFPTPPSKDEIPWESLRDGKYRLVGRNPKTGQFTRVLWRHRHGAPTKRIKLTLEDLQTILQAEVERLKTIQELAKQIQQLTGQTLPGLAQAQPQNPFENYKQLREALMNIKKEIDFWAEIFGYKRAEAVRATEPPYFEGKMPVWLHPQYGIPGLIDITLEKVEKRLARWGILPPEAVTQETTTTLKKQETSEELIKIPE